MGEPKSKEKSFHISKWLVWEAYQRIIHEGAGPVNPEKSGWGTVSGSWRVCVTQVSGSRLAR